MLKGIFVSGYNSKFGMTICVLGSLDVALELADDHHFPPLDTRWNDGEKSTEKLFNTLEEIMTYDWNIFLVVEAHCQEAIHPRWIFILARGFFLKCLFEE